MHPSKRDFLAKEDFSNLLHYTPHIVSVKHTKQAMIYTAKFKKLCNMSVTKIYWPFLLRNSLLWNLFLFATFKTSFFSLPPFDLIRKYVLKVILDFEHEKHVYIMFHFKDIKLLPYFAKKIKFQVKFTQVSKQK